MIIVVHRSYLTDVVDDSRYVINKLIERFGADAVKFDHSTRLAAYVFGVRVEFRHGDKYRMSGICPDYFYTPNSNVAEYLKYRHGKELDNLDDIARVIFEHCFKVTEVKKDADSERE